jgi:hypothetical protein
MPPKKKKKGRKSRSSTPGGQDTVGATLKARLEEVTAEYEAGVARRETLGKARLERMEVLAALEAEAELRRRGQDDAGERALERHEEAVSDLEGRIDELSAERATLEVELGALDLAVGTNERLRHEVFDARRAFEKEDGLMGGEEARVKEASFETGQDKRAKFPTSKAPISAVFHSFRLIFGRAIISRNGLEAWMLFPERARAEHSR